jgi:hypothetical protein
MKKLFTYLLLLFSVVAAHAQVTTGSLTGTIRDAKETLPGVSIKAIHVPSGTVYTGTSNRDGRYTISNLRPGGPYKLQFTYVGRETKTIEDVRIGLGDAYLLNLTMEATGSQLGEVAIKGSAKNSVMNASRTGTATVLTKNEINALPTLSRSLNDLIRLSPQANGAAIGGGNSRQNNVTVDGADFNNNFGIGNNLPANGNPVSIDALEEISVNVTPYDVKQSGFIGGSINAVTRSGTNEFSGSAYTYFRNQNQIGTHVQNYPELAQPTDQSYKTFGARLGGPIIKNKLFFFVNVERENEVSPGQQRIAATPEAPYNSGVPNVVRPTATELNEISDYLKTTYGYDPGIYQGYPSETERTNLLGRLDWNINANNHFNIRGSYVKTKSPSFVSSSRSPLAGLPSGGAPLAFKNSNYYQESNLYSITAELNSKIFDRFSNTLRASYTNQNDPRSSDSDIFPFVDILKSDGPGLPATPFTSFGYEPFTYGNLRDVQVYSLNDYLTWSVGKHNLTAGIQGDYNITKNGFQRFGTSYYRFNSWDDFKNGADPTMFAQTFSLSPGYEQAYPTFKFWQFSAYGQDEISLSDRLRVTGGIRLEYGTYPQILEEHPLVSALTFRNGERLNTGQLPKSRLSISPRFGFNWDVKGDRSLQLRGGAGIFTGRIPNVWIVSQAGDAGMLQVTQTYTAEANNIPGPFNPNIGAYRPTTVPTAGTLLPNPLSVMNKDLKMPSVFKASLAADIKLPMGFVASLEGIYNKDIRTVLFNNANLVDPVPLNVAGYPDNRMIYPKDATDRFINPILGGQAVPNGTRIAATPANPKPAQPDAFNVIELSNAHQGYYYSVSAGLSKRFDNGFGGSITYIRSVAKSLYEGSGDQAQSSWSATSTVNGANNPVLGYSGFVAPDRVIASLYYRKEFIKHLGTQITLVYDGSNGRSSYTYSSDINRDGVTGDLIYVPKDASEITFVPLTIGTAPNTITYSPQQQSDLFFRYVDQDKYLRGRKGKYAERNGAFTPFNGQFDFRFQQDLFTNVGGKRNTIQFNWDVVNFGNLLNRNWGTQVNGGTTSILVPANVPDLVAGGTTKPTFRIQTDRNFPVVNGYRDNVGFSSTFEMQFGFRYIFN